VNSKKPVKAVSGSVFMGFFIVFREFAFINLSILSNTSHFKPFKPDFSYIPFTSLLHLFFLLLHMNHIKAVDKAYLL